MEVGIVGLPLCGKTTLFKALTGNKIPVKDKEINMGAALVPDERVDALAAVFKSKKVVYASINVVDMPGVDPDDRKSTSRFLEGARSVDALVHVVRGFESDLVPHPMGRINPKEDAEILDTELIFADMEMAEKRLSAKKIPQEEKVLLDKASKVLEQEQLLVYGDSLTEEEKEQLKKMGFVTARPQMYVLNIEENTSKSLIDDFTMFAHEKGRLSLVVNAELESEISSLEPGEQKAFLEEYGIAEPAVVRLAKTLYDLLGLQSFLTAGEKEARAWTVKKGATAVEAAGVIHSDIARGFIRAEVVNWQDLVNVGGWKEAQQAGLVRLERKDYIIQEGDVLYFRFHV
ncbi:MAG TPA: redox-regulated ATPase YchF [Coprothermobacter proteolyticus]|mgnify:FL=1|nr:redox-regulated ATPase YchF [Coprothermobacter proteolyticus]